MLSQITVEFNVEVLCLHIRNIFNSEETSSDSDYCKNDNFLSSNENNLNLERHTLRKFVIQCVIYSIRWSLGPQLENQSYLTLDTFIGLALM